MKVDIHIPPYMNKTLMIVEYLQYMFAGTLGVELAMNATEKTPDWEARIESGDYQATIDELFAWHDPYVGMHRLYASGSRRGRRIWSNTIGLKDAGLDVLLQRAAREPGKTERYAVYKEVQQYLGGQYISVWLASAPYVTVYNTRVHGLENLYLGTMSPLDAVYVTGYSPFRQAKE